MPPQFVSNELRGVEAIAYKIQDNPNDEEICALSAQIDTCIKGYEHLPLRPNLAGLRFGYALSEPFGLVGHCVLIPIGD